MAYTKKTWQARFGITIPMIFSQSVPTGTSTIKDVLRYVLGISTGKTKASKLAADGFDSQV